MTGFEFRDLSGMDEFRAAEALQCAVWGEGDTPDPADLMMVIQAEGGLAGGAFLDGRLVGYIFGFPSATPGVQHSHRLAVLSELRGQGLGVALKQFQRRWCLARGIRHVRWTFDPMRTTNAALNMSRLGACSSTYLVDYYGVMGGINKGLPSDRLLADWHLEAPDVVALAEGRPRPSPARGGFRLELPARAEELIRDGGARALEARLALRDALQEAFASGFAIVDFDAATRQYVLAPA